MRVAFQHCDQNPPGWSICFGCVHPSKLLVERRIFLDAVSGEETMEKPMDLEKYGVRFLSFLCVFCFWLVCLIDVFVLFCLLACLLASLLLLLLLFV